MQLAPFLPLLALTQPDAPAPSPPDPAPIRILVHRLGASAGMEDRAQAITESILLHAGKMPGLVAIGDAELAILLEHEQQKHALEACGSQEDCLARVSSAASVQKLITGHVGRWGDGGNLVTLQILDVESSTLERGESCTTDSTAELEECTRFALERLLGTSPEERAFSLRVPGPGLRIAVLDLEAFGVEPGLARNLTELLALDLKGVDGVSVVTPSEIAMLMEYEYNKLVAIESTDVARLVEIGGALGVDYLVAGGVGRLEETYVLHLKLVSVSPAEISHRVSESFRGPERQLGHALRFAVARLLGLEREGRGSLLIRSKAGGVTAAIDGSDVVSLPMDGPKTDLNVGKHAITIGGDDDYYPLHLESYVEPNRLTELEVELVKVPRWYHSWWVWAAGGAVVAGATAAIVLTVLPPSGSTLIVGQ